jgi:signal transduction histidine kinase
VNQNINGTKARIIGYPRNSLLYKVYLWIKGRHWWIIGLAAVILFVLELTDFYRHNYDPIHIVEFVIYMGLLLVVGVLVDLLVSEIAMLNQTKKILDFKHKLSVELSGYHEWQKLLEVITQFPIRVAPVSQTCLFMADTMTGQFIPSASWNSPETDSVNSCTSAPCVDCQDDPSAGAALRKCEVEPTEAEDAALDCKYCLSFKYGGKVLGILQFKLDEGETLADGQVELLEGSGDEIGIALKAGQERQSFYEMQASKTALAERREVSHYLHDHLGQNLGYLHIKMDQLLLEKEQLTIQRVLDDLGPMSRAVNESYEIVRGILETIHAETAPSLTNLLMEHARKISQRANVDIDFKTRGKPVSLPREIEKAIFYAFEESLSNAEKHAQASRIDIVAEWVREQFILTITDDGVGFNPQSVDTDQHFGMEILNERMAKVNGRVTLTTSENSGTIVNINVPNPGMDGRLRGDIE